MGQGGRVIMYTQELINYYNSLDNPLPLWGLMESGVVTVTSGDASSGEVVVFQIKKIKGSCFLESRFKVFGCGYIIALVIWFSDILKLENFVFLKDKVTISYLVEKFNIPKEKRHCAICLLDIIDNLFSKSCE
jgi:hypothetical protein